MAKNRKQVRVALTGSVRVASASTPEPLTLETAKTDGVDQGFTTSDGVSFSFSREIEEIDSWQGKAALRKIVTETPSGVSFTLRQTNADTLTNTLGGTIEVITPADELTGTPAVVRWEPDLEQLAEKRVVVSFSDGAIEYVFVFRAATQNAEVEFSLVKNDALNLPNEWAAIEAEDGKKPVYLLSNDPALVPVTTTP